MKTSFLLLTAICLALFVSSTTPNTLGDLITFDDIVIDTITGSTNIPNDYRGFNWVNFGVQTPGNFTDGYYYGMVSPSNVAFNAAGEPAEIDSTSTNFDFLSAYLTGAFNSNLNIEVQGFNGTNMVYDETKVVSATNATLFTFDYLDIDRLYFNSYGGQPAGFASGAGEEFVMDNFEYEFIPEPSSFLLAALGGISLIAFLKRKRV